jgi:hypothetical protein
MGVPGEASSIATGLAQAIEAAGCLLSAPGAWGAQSTSASRVTNKKQVRASLVTYWQPAPSIWPHSAAGTHTGPMETSRTGHQPGTDRASVSDSGRFKPRFLDGWGHRRASYDVWSARWNSGVTRRFPASFGT